MGNRVLAVLQGRRLAGTLDQPLPADIRRTVPSRTIERGLQWLRENHPVDEDAAIMARIEREEREEEERLLKHAEEMGMLHPQSGYWGAQLGQQGDVYGRSVFKETRERNEKRLLEEAERERKEWLEGELKDREKIQRQQMQLQKHMELAEYNPSEVVEGMSIYTCIWSICTDGSSPATRGPKGTPVSCLGPEALHPGRKQRRGFLPSYNGKNHSIAR